VALDLVGVSLGLFGPVLLTRLPHGQYLPWVEKACGLKPQRAAELIKAANWIQTSGNAGHLESLADAQVLFLLSADATPDDVREWFMERCAAGDPPSRKDVQQLAHILPTYHPDSGLKACLPLERPSAYRALLLAHSISSCPASTRSL
jgi:hypothetical protein